MNSPLQVAATKNVVKKRRGDFSRLYWLNNWPIPVFYIEVGATANEFAPTAGRNQKMSLKT
ncbi:hypothetical protein H4J51_07760 [Colwellia sp. MB02u-18]|uniref:hypothetical protein n=1 Tax=unclassified Colwellia TaxID=196834 RepID=UPI0015F70A21|nr:MULTISPECIES: hypothetical protein [unclassified Colwellia]MBA6223802.1 hypothetical protein [Colwellia sp. MB3u-45]MBA6265958.1 hypothetical protein [Colwellia sp. MB3u-43]MBA6319983.1 hypothetical protein [Colwellia sp. MB02u-19]MBA6324473.1 hypothetical protein [Colwellia sp. MB02u-18]MBA6330628.1 hypothetical protein [Colwellia sp. MB02u-12]